MIRAAPPVQETIGFDLSFAAQFWNNPPCVDVWIDQVKIANLEIDRDQNFRFFQTCEFGQHELRLVRHGKTPRETRTGPNGDYETQTLALAGISIDGVNVKNIVWDRCEFFPEYPEPWATEQKKQNIQLESPVPRETVFGHNGIWVFRFRSPFYRFVVDCVRGNC